MGKTLKELMEERHPPKKAPTEAEITQRLVDRVSKSGKDMVSSGLDNLHPPQEKPTESAAVKLVKMKQKMGLGLSAKEKIVLGWEHLHGEVEEPEPIKEEPTTEAVVEPVATKTAAEIAEEAEAEWLAENKEDN